MYSVGDVMNNETNVKAIMSSYHLFRETDTFNDLLYHILLAVENAFPLPTGHKVKFELNLQHVWSAIYKKGHYTKPHNHYPSHLSFIYYLKSNNKSSPLIFKECDFQITPYDDLLVVFPSYLKHEVPPQTGDEDRICLAGNIAIIESK